MRIMPTRRQLLATLPVAALAPVAMPRPTWAQFFVKDQVKYWQREFPKTDFTRHVVPLEEIGDGGPPRDGIPALDAVEVIPVGEENGLDAREPVLVILVDGAPPRAYPHRYLMWHEIINDRIGDVPVLASWCPLCNTGLAWDRRVDGKALTFGVTGRLRKANLVMYDRETESWWQQADGRAIVGTLAGKRLAPLLSFTESWGAFRQRESAEVVKRPARKIGYGLNPYTRYDSYNWPYLYRGDAPPHGIPALARVVAVGERAWPLARVRRQGTIVEDGVRLVWHGGMASPLDSRKIAKGREIGWVEVTDAATGKPLRHDEMFAFAFTAHHPRGRWMVGPEENTDNDSAQ